MTKTINLALQGGGAHGAFTWGALNRLLEEEDLEYEAITATSAGAMNAAMMVTGLAKGGRQGAKDLLSEFWHKIVERAAGPSSPFTMFAMPPDPATLSGFYEYSPAYMMGDWLTRTFSPYQLNPLNINPLRDLLEEMVDFKEVCGEPGPKVFINATSVRHGRPKVFTGDEITVDAILASACLPYLFQAVEIDGEPYWDGGYVGNPAIYPLIYNAKCRDVLIVHINPIERDGTPKSAGEISNRINEISFNASLTREMRAIDFVQHLIDDGVIDKDKWKRMRVHSIRDDATMATFNVATKITPDWNVINELRDAGRSTADAWLKAHKSKIGKTDSVNIKEDFL